MGFPAGVPGIRYSIFQPENFIFPVFDYDWGPDFNASDATGVPTNLPPPIRKVIPMKVPRVNADGNELGGVPTVLNEAPLGTYLGWNITAGGFHAGQVCNYTGGYVPFARTLAERLATGDPRRSLQERYVNHAGYVAAVTVAANSAHAQGYLLAADRDALIAAVAAPASRSPSSRPPQCPSRPLRRCCWPRWPVPLACAGGTSLPADTGLARPLRQSRAGGARFRVCARPPCRPRTSGPVRRCRPGC